MEIIVQNIVPSFGVSTKTNKGELSKQYFKVVKAEGMEETLIITKLVLSDDHWLYRTYESVKNWKGKTLYRTKFSIKTSTLEAALSFINHEKKSS